MNTKEEKINYIYYNIENLNYIKIDRIKSFFYFEKLDEPIIFTELIQDIFDLILKKECTNLKERIIFSKSMTITSAAATYKTPFFISFKKNIMLFSLFGNEENETNFYFNISKIISISEIVPQQKILIGYMDSTSCEVDTKIQKFENNYKKGTYVYFRKSLLFEK